MALLLSAPGLLTDEQLAVGRDIASHALEVPSGGLFWKAVVAGTIVASMVVAHPTASATGLSRIICVYLLMLLIPTADLFHCITGFCEVVFGVLQDVGTLPDAPAVPHRGGARQHPRRGWSWWRPSTTARPSTGASRTATAACCSSGGATSCSATTRAAPVVTASHRS